METRSVKRAVEILQHIGSEQNGLSLSEVSRRVQLSKATVYRILQTLVDTQFARQDGQTSRYFLGSGLLRLARGADPHESLVRVARPVMEALRDRTRETVTLVVPSGDQRLTIDVVLGTHELKAAPEKGSTKPLYAGAAGRALLAYLPAGQTSELLGRTRLKPVAPATITSREALTRELFAVRGAGLAKSLEEAVPGQFGIAAPIFVDGDTVVAALNLCGPTVRVTADSMELLGRQVVAAAKRISRELSAAARAA